MPKPPAKEKKAPESAAKNRGPGAIPNNKNISDLQNSLSEKDILLSLNSDIASVKDKTDVLKIIHPKLKMLFGTDDIFICSLDTKKETLNPILRVGGKRRTENIAYNKIIHASLPIHDGFIDTILGSKEPLVFNIDEENKKANAPEYMKISKATGLAETLSTSLYHGGELIGMLTLWAETANFFTPHHKALISQIADQVSILITNIKASELIKKRDEENETLLLISNKIAAIRNKEDLSNILSGTLKEHIPFNDCAITIYNKAKNVYSIYAYHVDEKRLNHPLFQKAINAEYPLSDNDLSNPHTAVVIEIDKLHDNRNNTVGFIEAAGIKEIASIKLVDGDDLIGLFVLLAEQKKTFTDSSLYIMQRISYQVSIAVAKLLANEEIKKREAEKSLLLSLSNEMALVRGHNDLAKIINQKLKKLFSIKDFTIVAFKENRLTHGVYLFDETDTPYKEKKREYLETLFNRFRFEKGLYDVVSASDDPVVFNIRDIVKSDAAPGHIRFFDSLGIEEIVGANLRIGNEDIGILWIQPEQPNSFNNINQHVFKAVCSQISIALANIIANEQIANQLAEINSYRKKLEDENIYLQEQIKTESKYGEIVGNGSEMQKVYHLLTQVAFTNSTVLILGETGTGKELIARAIHNASPRKDKLMIKVNCAALPPNLVESELFGHERGSFTGATERRIGKFELANHSTIFLDEIGELSPEVQAKLLRVLQEKEVERVGGKTTIKVDVRIITATNRNLQKEVDEGNFRTDLFYRLNVFPIALPALRERKEDIPVLAAHFMANYSKTAGKQVNNISNKVMKELVSYNWPGNVRELEHQVERSVLLTNGSTIKEIQLPSANRNKDKSNVDDLYSKSLEQNERDHILQILKKCNGKVFGKNGAADILGIPVSTLNSRIKKLGIKKEHAFTTLKTK